MRPKVAIEMDNAGPDSLFSKPYGFLAGLQAAKGNSGT